MKYIDNFRAERKGESRWDQLISSLEEQFKKLGNIINKILYNGLETASKVRAYRGATQENVPNVTATKVELNAETYDPGGNFDKDTNHRFVAPVSGYYDIDATIKYDSVVANKRYFAMIKVDGTTKAQANQHSSHAGEISVLVSDRLYVAKDSYVELFAYHTAGVDTVDIVGSEAKTYMVIHLASL